jgi:N-acetylneuraminic acid mutarotase
MACVVNNQHLYLFGGGTQWSSANVKRAARFNGNSWTTLPDMPFGRLGAAGGYLANKDRIYIVGGLDVNGNSLSSMHVYTVSTQSWTLSTKAMSTPRDNCGGAVLTRAGIQRVYVFGGRTRQSNGNTIDNQLASAEYFTPYSGNPANGVWATAASMTVPRRAMGVTVMNNEAYVVGGESPTLSSVEVYDPNNDHWRTLTPLPTGRHGVSVGVVVDNNVDVMIACGGGATSGNSVSRLCETFTY